MEFRFLEFLMSLSSAKTPELSEHQASCARWAELVAREMALSEEEIQITATAALVHDVGKVVLPLGLLLKPFALTEEERKLVVRHPAAGEELVLCALALELDRELCSDEIARAVRHHHERWDGLGYPDGLSGEAIPLFSRIIAVADALEAMTGKRSYRKPVTLREAAGEISRCSGSQFDPGCVRALLSALKKLAATGSLGAE